jgi:uncharacterized membrane protein
MNHEETENDISARFFGGNYESLDEDRKKVTHHIAAHKHISKNTADSFNESLTFGQRIADKVASFGGSWPFIIIFATIISLWMLLNSYLLVKNNLVFDPYPYILLNLGLSMLAAVQAPVILMSANRQAARDRQTAEHDYEVNLKAEIEIMALHDKVDSLREKQWDALIKMQQEQIDMLKNLVTQLESSNK